MADKDCLLIYDYEGQGSPAGSVAGTSLLDFNNDLQFLDDLGPKFKTLAEVCGAKKIPTDIEPAVPSVSFNTHSSVSTAVTSPQLPPLALQKSGMQTVETSETSHIQRDSRTRLSQEMGSINSGTVNQSQMLLLQHQTPVYMTTTPVVQQMHYVVQPQVQNTMLLAEAPATNLQGMVLVNSAQATPTRSVVLQGQPLLSSGQVQGPGMMLLETSGTKGLNSNLIQAGSISGSQAVMVVEGKVPAGSVKVLKGGQSCLIDSRMLQPGSLPGSQEVVVVGGPVSTGAQLVKGTGGGAQKVLHSKGNITAGSKNSIVTPSSSMVGSGGQIVQSLQALSPKSHTSGSQVITTNTTSAFKVLASPTSTPGKTTSLS